MLCGLCTLLTSWNAVDTCLICVKCIALLVCHIIYIYCTQCSIIALCSASWEGHQEMVHLLLQKKADVSIRDEVHMSCVT